MNSIVIGNKIFEAHPRETGNIDIYHDNPYGQNFLIQFANKNELQNFIHFLNEVIEEVSE